MALANKGREPLTMVPSEAMPRAMRSDLTELAAAKFVECHGRSGLAILQERAELSDQLGHKVAARSWRMMADAAARLLRTKTNGGRHPARVAGRRP